MRTPERQPLVDIEKGEIWTRCDEIRLTPAELRLLGVLKRKEGRPVPARVLEAELDSDPCGAGGGSPRYHILNLRRKLGHSEAWPIITTYSGIGYALVPGSLRFTAENDYDHR